MIILTQKPDDIPFDLKDRFHIVYDPDDLGDLQKKLAARLGWEFGELAKGKSVTDPALTVAVNRVVLKAGEDVTVDGQALAISVTNTSQFSAETIQVRPSLLLPANVKACYRHRPVPGLPVQFPLVPHEGRNQVTFDPMMLLPGASDMTTPVVLTLNRRGESCCAIRMSVRILRDGPPLDFPVVFGQSSARVRVAP